MENKQLNTKEFLEHLDRERENFLDCLQGFKDTNEFEFTLSIKGCETKFMICAENYHKIVEILKDEL